MPTTSSIPCTVCRYPVSEPAYIGQQIKCPYCGTINEAIAGVEIPTSVLTFIGGLTVGLVFGPAILDSIRAGSEKMATKARARLA